MIKNGVQYDLRRLKIIFHLLIGFKFALISKFFVYYFSTRPAIEHWCQFKHIKMNRTGLQNQDSI